MIENIGLVTVLLLLATNILTVWIALRAERQNRVQLRIEFYRGFYASRLLAFPRRPNRCRLATRQALADDLHEINLPGWRWPLPRAYPLRDTKRYIGGKLCPKTKSF